MSTHEPVPATRSERLSSAVITVAAAAIAGVGAALVVGGAIMLVAVRPSYPGESLTSLAIEAPAWVGPVSLSASVLLSWLIVARLGIRTMGDTVMYLTAVRQAAPTEDSLALTPRPADLGAAAGASARGETGAAAQIIGQADTMLPAGRLATLVRTGIPAALLLAGALAHQVPLAVVVVALLWAPALGRDGRSAFDRVAGVHVLSYNVRRQPVDPAVAEKWARIQRAG